MSPDPRRAWFARALLLGLVLVPIGTPVLLAQQDSASQRVMLAGRVLLGPDSIPTPGLEVSLHRIGAEEGGVAGTAVTDGEGRFAFPVEAAENEEDRSTVYLVTARYKDVVYFGEALHMVREPQNDYLIRVYETRPSSTFPITRRQTVVAANGAVFEVLDMFELGNDSDSSLVRAAGAESDWTVHLPEGAGAVADVSTGFGLGSFEVSGDAVRFDFEVPPGGRAFNIQYRLDRADLRLAPSGSGEHEILVDPLIRVTDGMGWEDGPLLDLGGRQFRRLVSADGAGPVSLSLEVGGVADPGRYAWWYAGAGLLLAAAALLSWRRGLRDKGRSA